MNSKISQEDQKEANMASSCSDDDINHSEDNKNNPNPPRPTIRTKKINVFSFLCIKVYDTVQQEEIKDNPGYNI